MFKKCLLVITLFVIIGIKSPLLCNAVESTKPTKNTELSSLLKEANSYIIKDHAKSIETYKKALEIDPKSAEANYNIGALYLFDDEPEKSLPYFQTTLKYNPKYVLAYSAITVNCDVLAEYDLTLKYIKKYKSEFPKDKLNNELADKQLQTTISKKKYSDELINKVIPRVEMDITAPKWVPGNRLSNKDIDLSQLIVRGTNVDTTPETLIFYEFKNLGSKFNSAYAFVTASIYGLKKMSPNNLDYNIIESNDKYTIYEVYQDKKYFLYKCELVNNSIYCIHYGRFKSSISDEKRQYWINALKKAKFLY